MNHHQREFRASHVIGIVLVLFTGCIVIFGSPYILSRNQATELKTQLASAQERLSEQDETISGQQRELEQLRETGASSELANTLQEMQTVQLQAEQVQADNLATGNEMVASLDVLHQAFYPPATDNIDTVPREELLAVQQELKSSKQDVARGWVWLEKFAEATGTNTPQQALDRARLFASQVAFHANETNKLTRQIKDRDLQIADLQGDVLVYKARAEKAEQLENTNNPAAGSQGVVGCRCCYGATATANPVAPSATYYAPAATTFYAPTPTYYAPVAPVTTYYAPAAVYYYVQ